MWCPAQVWVAGNASSGGARCLCLPQGNIFENTHPSGEICCCTNCRNLQGSQTFVLPVDTELVLLYIQSSVGSQGIFGLDLKLRDQTCLWLIISSALLLQIIWISCESVTKVMALVVTGGAGCPVSLMDFLSDGTLGMAVSGWMTRSLFCLVIESVCFDLEIRAETFFPLMFALPMPSCR